MMTAFRYMSPGFHVSTALALLAALLVVGVSQTWAQDHSMHSGHTGHEGMPSGMHGSQHMTVMARIQAEHLNFAATGFGIGAFKGLSDLPTRWQAMFARLWPLMMIVLGVLLMLYSE